MIRNLYALILSLMMIAPLHAAEIGVYVGAGCTGTANLSTWNTWSGKPVDRASEGIPYDSWASLASESSWAIKCWQKAALTKGMTFSVPMLVADKVSTIAQGAAGAYDQTFTNLATALVAGGFGGATLRLGWEFNGGWYPWAAKSDPVTWIAYYRHIVGVMRAVPGTAFKWCWNPDWGYQQVAPSKVYPGDDVVDYVAEDVYDDSWPVIASPSARWNSLLTSSYGLNWLATFAAQHGKQIAIPEWGVTYRTDGHGGGDDPYYVNSMVGWFQTHNVAFQAYFDFNNPTIQSALLNVQGSRYQTNQFPLSAAAYLRAFSPVVK